MQILVYFSEKSLDVLMINSSSLPKVFCEKGVFRIVAKFTGKHLCQSLFFNKVARTGVFL